MTMTLSGGGAVDSKDANSEKTAGPGHAGGGPTFAEGDLGTIQGILFGAQADQFEKQIASLEERLVAQIADNRKQVEAEITKSAKRLQDGSDKAMAALSAEAAAEHEARLAAVDALEQGQREQVKTVEESLEGIRAELRALNLSRRELADLFESAARAVRPPDDA